MEEEVKTKDVKFDIYQILNELQIVGRNRKLIFERNSSKPATTKKEWLKIFKEDGIEF